MELYIHCRTFCIFVLIWIKVINMFFIDSQTCYILIQRQINYLLFCLIWNTLWYNTVSQQLYCYIYFRFWVLLIQLKWLFLKMQFVVFFQKISLCLSVIVGKDHCSSLPLQSSCVASSLWNMLFPILHIFAVSEWNISNGLK